MKVMEPNEVFSRKHLLSWYLLAFSAGAVNAGALLACHRYVTHVTGTATRIGVDWGRWTAMGDLALVFVCFVLGAMVAVLIPEWRKRRGLAPLTWLPLALVASLLAVTALGGTAGWFGAFGHPVDVREDFGILSILSFAMGLQNASVSVSTGHLVRTTHLTGPATDLGMSAARMILEPGGPRSEDVRLALLRGGKIVSFVGGGAAMLPLAHRFAYLAFLMPAVATLVVTARSFVLRQSVAHEPRAEHAERTERIEHAERPSRTPPERRPVPQTGGIVRESATLRM